MYHLSRIEKHSSKTPVLQIQNLQIATHVLEENPAFQFKKDRNKEEIKSGAFCD